MKKLAKLICQTCPLAYLVPGKQIVKCRRGGKMPEDKICDKTEEEIKKFATKSELERMKIK